MGREFLHSDIPKDVSALGAGRSLLHQHPGRGLRERRAESAGEAAREDTVAQIKEDLDRDLPRVYLCLEKTLKRFT